MESLEEAMSQLLRDRVHLLLRRISERYHIDEDDLQHLLNAPPPDTEQVVVTEENVKFCNHKFTKGKRIGMTCLQKISSIHSGKCSKHQPKKNKTKHDNESPSTTAATGSDDELSIPDTFNGISTTTLIHSDEEFNSE
jgi:hypothetical protein